MKTIQWSLMSIIASAALLSPSAALAGEGNGCHFHGYKPAAESVVLECADQRKAALIKSGKIDASWTAIKPEKPELLDKKLSKEWKITYKDPKAKETNKQSLYMFFTPAGNFVAANFTAQ
jgi:Family of unknown function (DUF6488)